ncbi:MAG: aa3-type cytochrome c oxidase subunit IV [Hyphomicrobiales bacterium]|nr:aa3-type cytochrome c oxidase subunit IV [Hyphomicrobiales bacterium]
MTNNHGAMTADDPMDMAEHEKTYASFVSLTEIVVAHLLCILLLLVLWALEGHGFIALIGLILTMLSATVGGLTGAGWRMVAPVFVLLGLACIVLK